VRIGIDCRQIYDVQKNEGAGVARYIFHLVKNVLAYDEKNEFVLFCYGDLGSETIRKVKGGNSRVKIVKVLRAESRLPLWTNHVGFAFAVRKEKLDWAIFPANVMPFFYFGKALVVVHDLAIYRHPKWFPGGQWWARRVVVPASVKRAEAVVCVSKNTKQDLLTLFSVRPEKVQVIYPGVEVSIDCSSAEEAEVVKKYGAAGDYLFFIGTIEPRKNIANLLKAFHAFIGENEEEKVKLIVAGAPGWKCAAVLKMLGHENRFARVSYVGAVSDKERNVLMKNCRAFVFPSYYEGFGLPVAEAMALGVPVITSDNSSLREIADDAAVLVDPHDPAALARSFKSVLHDKVLRYQLISRGKERVKLFDWQIMVEKIVELLK